MYFNKLFATIFNDWYIDIMLFVMYYCWTIPLNYSVVIPTKKAQSKDLSDSMIISTKKAQSKDPLCLLCRNNHGIVQQNSSTIVHNEEHNIHVSVIEYGGE